MTQAAETGNERDLRLYNLFTICQASYFWTPLFFLYFVSMVSLPRVFLLEAVYYTAVVLTELPSGYFSDRWGRRKTLLLSSLFLVISYSLFALGRRFAVLAAAQVFLAMGFSFASGTDTSLHFALLRAAGRKGEYGNRESLIASRIFKATALSALVGGFLAWQSEYHSAYILSFLFAAASLIIMLMINDPEKKRTSDGGGASFGTQMKILATALGNPALRFLFVFSLLSVILRHIPYEFFQVYIRDAANGMGRQDLTPMVTGIHAAGAMLAASWFTRLSMPLKRRLGSRKALTLTIAAQTALIAFFLVADSPIVVILLLLRSSPGSFSTPIARSEISPRIPDAQRATLYSLQSLAGRLGFSTLLLAFNGLTNGGGITRAVRLGSLLGLAALALTILLGRGFKEKGNPFPSD